LSGCRRCCALAARNVSLAEKVTERRVPPTPVEISFADWTFDRLLELPAKTRRLMNARGHDVSFDKIVARMQLNGIDTKKKTIIDWDRQSRR
jgi:hypothetical protein